MGLSSTPARPLADRHINVREINCHAIPQKSAKDGRSPSSARDDSPSCRGVACPLIGRPGLGPVTALHACPDRSLVRPWAGAASSSSPETTVLETKNSRVNKKADEQEKPGKPDPCWINAAVAPGERFSASGGFDASTAQPAAGATTAVPNRHHIPTYRRHSKRVTSALIPASDQSAWHGDQSISGQLIRGEGPKPVHQRPAHQGRGTETSSSDHFDNNPRSARQRLDNR